jgi:hypothetical protein
MSGRNGVENDEAEKVQRREEAVGWPAQQVVLQGGF